MSNRCGKLASDRGKALVTADLAHVIVTGWLYLALWFGTFKVMPDVLGVLVALTIALGLPLILWAAIYSQRKKIEAYNLDPRGREGAFEPLLQKYLRLSEFMIGLATGSNCSAHWFFGFARKGRTPTLLLSTSAGASCRIGSLGASVHDIDDPQLRKLAARQSTYGRSLFSH
jgi:hypothetical protein